jgi:hypothetical protein
MVQLPLGSRRRATLLGTCVLLLPAACGDDTPDRVDATAVCSRLEDLSTAVLEAQTDAETIEEAADVIEGPLARFVEAAEASADDELAELAHAYEEAFSAYRTGDGLDAREAGNDADIALDRAGARCIELGATNPDDLPQEPAN